MVSADIWSVFQGLGAILAVSFTIGAAGVKVYRTSRARKSAATAGQIAETSHLETTVKELVEVLGGKERTALNKGSLGLLDRFEALETKVDAHDEKLTDIAAGVATLLENRA